MTRKVQCALLGIEAEGFDRPPYPGDIGQRVFDSISREAWQKWVAYQTMLINEYRLTPIDPNAREFLEGAVKFHRGGRLKKPTVSIIADAQA